jgi:WD40 repeat protein
MPKWLKIALTVVMGCAVSLSLRAQVESIKALPRPPTWVSHGRIEGHLALSCSPAVAFSPDNSLLAVVNEDRVVLLDLRAGNIQKVLRPHIQYITDLQIQSANFLAQNILFSLGTGLLHPNGKGPGQPTPPLAFEWDVEQDALVGKVNALGAKGGFGSARYFPQIGYLALYKSSNFDLWNPRDGRGGRIAIPDLTQSPNLFEFSPDGHWLLLAQIAGSSTADPVVIKLSEHRFVDSLRGHQGTVLSIAFSRDCAQVVTACEDGKVRIFSVPDWKLSHTLTGHQGPVHWAEFSPDGKWVVSAGEDHTVRVWSAGDGKLLQSLQESPVPLLTVSFSPHGDYVAASSEHTVLVWQRTEGGQ